MKTKKFFTALMAALTMAALPCTMTFAEETTDTVQKPTSVPATKINPVMTVNGRPATPAEKAVAKQMVKQGAKMAAKSAKMAVKAVTDPSKVDQMSQELEAMGSEMERLGDSLEALTEDTTFLYEGEDEDSVFFSDSDFEDLDEDVEWLHSFWGKLFGGSMGIIGGIFGILMAILLIVLLFLVFTSPLWVIALIVWLIVRNNRKPRTTAYVNPPLNAATSQTTEGASTTTDANAATTANTAAPATGYVQPYPDENTEMWKSGVMTACVGVGLIILFVSIGLEDLWGIGALVACIGVAKLVIASTTKKKNASPTQESTGSYRNTPASADQDYNKSEN